MTAQNYGYMARHITSTERIPARSLEKEVKVTKSNITICRPHMGGSILPADTGPRHTPPKWRPPAERPGEGGRERPGEKEGGAARKVTGLPSRAPPKAAAACSPTLPGSTIGACGLNFSVRNGKRCDPAASPPLVFPEPPSGIPYAGRENFEMKSQT